MVFFKYYSYRDNCQLVHCPLTGELIRKKDIVELHLPPPYRTYKFNLLRNIIKEKFLITSGLCVQDPIQLNCNLTYTLQENELYNFWGLCKETFTLWKPLIANQNQHSPRIVKSKSRNPRPLMQANVNLRRSRSRVNFRRSTEDITDFL